MTTFSKKSTPLIIGLILSLGAVSLGFIVDVNHEESAKLAARWTSRVGVPVFLVAYLASTLFRVSKNNLTKTIMQTRRQWGLAFAWTHSVHLVALTYYLNLINSPPDLLTILGGGLAYVMIYVMAATSNDWSVRKLGRNWKRLHRFGIHYIWFIYTFTYAGRFVDPDMLTTGIFGTGILLAAFIFRIAIAFRSKLSKSTSVAQTGQSTECSLSDCGFHAGVIACSGTSFLRQADFAWCAT